MEIERKFLASEIPFDLNDFEKQEIKQAYISTDPAIRLRKCNDQYILTIKGKGHIEREEFEFELTDMQFQNLWHKIETKVVSKIRYFIPIDNDLVAEIDIYDEQLTGLATIEVEFETKLEATNFVPPEWFGPDVTYDTRYKNSSLSQFGIPK